MSKSLVLSFIKNSDKIKTSVISGNFDNPIVGTKWELKVEGEFKNMQNNDGFSKKQLEQIAQVVVATVQPMINSAIDPINNRLDKIESRLDVLESFHKDDLKSK